ncbi:MAG: 4-hydroxybenzoate octaprenyltransferase [Gammaproteobacteria bacterium CG11_big_fil_rev_8_21_14_0_20_46_22]|nr:MAG: 4-hydroxybenzoate octaprenyltransferase [Gammaproteobacteria bacterium CG12_big_fil_rev_8_21_14_0_65_46_12]PIR11926.1 MAG: 4-hydroxybenzoate octaprenyltransferase [Gammaproteobacteria bacterium CG11_big_fil_rev_8_21_14_0_20_46_22]
MIRHYLALTRFDKPIGSLLLLWPTLTALFLAAQGRPSAKNLVIFTLGVFLMRSAGCIVNDLLDRKLDRHVARTQNRPLAANQISPTQAVILLAILLLGALLLVLPTNAETILLAFVALAMTLAYPLMKRYTHWPQAWLGACFNFGIIMAFSASNKPLGLSCWLLYAANIVFTVAYDTFYAMVDRDDDIKIGIKSTAVLFGDNDRRYIAIFHIVYLLLIVIVSQITSLNHWFDFGLALAIASLAYQHTITRHRKKTDFFKAFLNSHYTLLAIFLGVYLSLLPY